ISVFIVLAFIPVALFRLCFNNPFSSIDDTSKTLQHTYSSPSSTQGRWVRDEMGPLYNGSSCGTIKDGQNCLRHDMADQILVIFIGNGNRTNAIYRDSTLTDKQLAFVVDSMTRNHSNQLESLICLLSTVSSPDLVYSNEDNRFRRWRFESHNVSTLRSRFTGPRFLWPV
ncbi:hypothetical protein HID58_047092, partial [Brassica napus]